MYINNMYIEELQNNIVEKGFRKFRGEQIYRWMHKNYVDDFDRMNNLPKELIDSLKAQFLIDKIEIFKKLESKEDETKKYLFKLNDGNIIESVYLKYDYGKSVCISSQVGCNMGCVFCASTRNGKTRNLRASEMLNQLYMIEKDLKATINSIVVMGSGEPFDNYENLKKFINIVTSPQGKNLSIRKITVSTCGIIPIIYKAADEDIGFNLAVSLHGANQKKRDYLIPASKSYPINDLIRSCEYYTQKTGRRVTYEYVMIKGVNDTMEDAKDLVTLLKKSNCHINLIPLNVVGEFNGKAADDKSIKQFYNELRKNNLNTTIRRELGRDINAACGQLRNQYLSSEQGIL